MSTPSPSLSDTNALAEAALPLWDLPATARLTLVNVSENVTYRVDAPNWRSILRVHRPGYHSCRAIECELAWMAALAQDGSLAVPQPIAGRNGQAIQSVSDGPDMRHMVMFAFIEGEAPDESDDLAPAFRTLGTLAARAHLHAIDWPKPAPFERLVWDTEAVFGTSPTWGNWRDAPHLSMPDRAVLEEVEAALCRCLTTYGKGPDRYGLIHADMRLANLIMVGDRPRVIDFDDCGLGWFMYDFAAAISFMEDSPQIPALRDAWVDGYRTVRPLTAADEVALGAMVMLRRMALLAWIGSHMDAPEPQALAPDFARVSAHLGKDWLASISG